MSDEALKGTLRSVITILAMTAIGALLGLLFGVVLAHSAPDFIRALFGGARQALDPAGRPLPPRNFPLEVTQVGIGLGLVNGAIMGFAAGNVTVLATAWVSGRRLLGGR